ncbi:MAG: MTH938/NDUFAF3 family protein [Gammaproteobacteria bacterium]|nr:MTH938/NDUFAF3 family protein [Gammaproteobacteria bacterium]
MKIELEPDLRNQNTITAYSEGRIFIHDTCIESSCIITAQQIIHDWQPVSIDDIRCPDFDAVIALEPEIILLGTGTRAAIPPMEICAYIQGKNIGFEFMDSGAAIRSYNILLREDRKVALALLLS